MAVFLRHISRILGVLNNRLPAKKPLFMSPLGALQNRYRELLSIGCQNEPI
jgi:hypothetical protein